MSTTIHHELPPGTLLHNRYRIESVIGQGGFGITYKAVNLGLNQVVCIKELFAAGICVRGPENTVVFQGREAAEFPAFRQRFIREAQELARFRHPNIVRVSEVFEANQTAYFVMDFVEGETLRERVLREGRLQPEQALPLMHSLLDAVETVHNAGMLHRDIKPDNILVEPSGRVVLIDFGSARSNSNSGTYTTTAFVSPPYSPLEQYSHSAPRGPYTDIYALGATFYFMLTGTRPIAAADRRDRVMPAPHVLYTDISDILSSAIMLALEERPNDRFQTVHEFRVALNSTGKLNQKGIGLGWFLRLPARFRSRRGFLAVAGLLLLSWVAYQYGYKSFKTGKPTAAIKGKKSKNGPVKGKSGNGSGGSTTQQKPAPAVTAAQREKARKDAVIQRMRNNLVLVKGGTFRMGCTDEQGRDCYDHVHTVQLNSFHIGKYEVTQEEWQAVMGSNPSYFSNCPNCPVDNVSWNDIQSFLQKLNKQTGLQFSLPTEAEWEYAARGGNRSGGHKFSGSDNIASVAWYDGNSGSRTHPVGQKQANALGIYDMTGNVYEWCSDWYGENYYSNSPVTNPRGPFSGTGRVLRGGSWRIVSTWCRISFRTRGNPDYSSGSTGFRLVSPG
ncbi:MAG: SUMF1/EgtB/PvdO family nonheme iron enzyme [Bacteroidota bacterium]